MWLLGWLRPHHVTPELIAPECPLDWSTSLVRAGHGKQSKLAGSVDIRAWMKRQKRAGRFVISDSHFKIGKNLRSVPILGDPSQCSLVKRRKLEAKIKENRKALNLS